MDEGKVIDLQDRISLGEKAARAADCVALYSVAREETIVKQVIAKLRAGDLTAVEALQAWAAVAELRALVKSVEKDIAQGAQAQRALGPPAGSRPGG